MLLSQGTHLTEKWSTQSHADDHDDDKEKKPKIPLISSKEDHMYKTYRKFYKCRRRTE